MPANPTSNRTQHDRRSRPRFLSMELLGVGSGARHNLARRSGDRVVYVDSYPPQLLISVLLIMICGIVDAALTLHLLSNGALELNTAMATLIERDAQLFVSLKLALTALSLLLLVIYKNVRCLWRLRCEHLVYGVLAFYLTLNAYELNLLSVI